ncbi:MAG: TonB-dependent receptor domain-containing protein, partial [Bacteroidota bacterium]
FSDFLSAYAFWGVGHREPNRDDYTQSSPSSRPLAEQLSDTEAGIRFAKEGFTLAANLFYMQYKNQLIPDGRINDVGAYIRTNVPDSYRAGVELEASLSAGIWQFA